MGAFVVLSGVASCESWDVARGLLSQSGWACSTADETLQAWTLGSPAPRFHFELLGADLVIGDVAPRAAGRSLQDLRGRAASRLDAARSLSRRIFGSYAAFWAATSDRGLAAFRGPSGACDLLVWRWRDLTVASSTLADAGLRGLLGRTEIDWSRVEDWLVDPSEISGDLALSTVQAVTPGDLWEDDGGAGRREAVWRPGWLLRDEDENEGGAAGAARQELSERLGSAVDAAVAPLAQGSDRWLGELSGGLDSSIVAASWRRWRDPNTVTWVNYWAEEAAADERVHARAMAAWLGVALQELRKRDGIIRLEDLAEVSGGARPALNAMDPDYDLAITGLAETLGRDALITGQGGDTVFWTRRTPLVAGARGRGSLFGPWEPALRSVARWSRTSVWRVLAANRRPERWLREAREGVALSFVARDLASSGIPRRSHGWRQDLESAPPTKQLQIGELVACQSLFGEAPRTRRLRVEAPLLSQPVVEVSLATPAIDLIDGVGDRGLARRAFAGRLAPSVLNRRGKGDLTGFYGRRLANSIGAVRGLLLDGHLARRGLVDRKMLEVLLDPDVLVWRGDYGDIMDALAMEAWLSFWVDRQP